MQKTKYFVFVLFVAILMTSQTMSGTTQDGAAKLGTANTKFGLKLLSKMREAGSPQNLLFSPSSISWCLGMALNAAQGLTRDEIAKATEISGITIGDLNQAYADWKNISLIGDPKVEVDIANSIWARRGIGLKQEFVTATKNSFGAEVAELNFDDPRSIGLINNWVKSKTRNKIEQIVDSISSDSMLFLINAVYFNGKWTTAFDPAKTKNEEFTSYSGSKHQVPMMRQRGTFGYLESSDFQAVRLPYGKQRFSMDIFLPADRINLQQFLSKVTTENWNSWKTTFEEAEGEIALPRFRVEYELPLNSALKALGMKAAFDPHAADFSGMVQTNSQRPYISSVKHKAFAEINEEGTEAAAVTSTEFRAVSMPIPSKTFRMIINRPFFFVIQDHETDTLLFIGTITSL